MLAQALWLLAVRGGSSMTCGSSRGWAWRGPADWRWRWCSTGCVLARARACAVYLLLGLLTGALSRRQLELTRA